MRIARDIASRAPLAIRILKAEIHKLIAGAVLSADDFEEIQNLRKGAFRGRHLSFTGLHFLILFDRMYRFSRIDLSHLKE